MRDGDPFDRSLEVWLDFDDGGRGRADILLVSLVHDRPTLLLIEVKLDAQPQVSRNPVEQLITYRPAVRRDAGSRWRVRTWAIALEFHPTVLTQARALRIPCSRSSENGRRLKLLQGFPPVDVES